MRTFLALCGSVGTTRRIVETMEQKAIELAAAGWKLAWVPPSNLHVTLKFFGSIPPESVEAIKLSLRKRLVDLPPPVLRFHGCGVFPAPAEGAPRVLWVGVDGGKALLTLQQSIDSDLEALGFAREVRPYHAHLTVARVIEPPADPSACQWKTDPPGSLEGKDFGEDRIVELVIYESTIDKSHRAGVEYRALGRVPFTNSTK